MEFKGTWRVCTKNMQMRWSLYSRHTPFLTTLQTRGANSFLLLVTKVVAIANSRSSFFRIKIKNFLKFNVTRGDNFYIELGRNNTPVFFFSTNERRWEIFILIYYYRRIEKKNYWILLIKEKNMQGIWWRGIDRNARTKVICVRGRERGLGGEREKQQEARKQERFWSCSICIRAFCVCKSSAPTILFSRSTLPTKRLCRAPTLPPEFSHKIFN